MIGKCSWRLVFYWWKVNVFRSEKRKKITSKDGTYSIVIEFKNGSMNCATFDADGTLLIGSDAK